MPKQIKLIPLSLGVFILSLLSVIYTLAWTGPPGAPTACPSGSQGCDVPLNVGPTAQTKSGDLLVNVLTTSGGTLYLNDLGEEGNIERANEIIGRDDLHLKSDANTTAIYLGRAAPNDFMGFYTGVGVERMRIDSSGNVGIGTNSPSYKLDLNGAFRLQATAAPTAANGVIYYDSSTNKFRCYQGGAWVDCIASGGLAGSGAANQVAFFTGASTLGSDPGFYWDNTNKRLGVGTTAPSEKLEIAGSAKANKFLVTQNSGGLGLQMNLTSSPGGGNAPFLVWDSRNGGASYLFGVRQETNNLTFRSFTDYWTGNLPMLTLTGSGNVYLSESGGNVGIGTNSVDSSYKLTVAGGGIKVTASSQPAGYFYSDTGYGLLVDKGNVGIGTNSPSYKLDLNGAFRLQATAAPTGANGVIYYDSSANKFRCYQAGAWVDCIASGGLAGSGAANQVAFFTGASTLGSDPGFYWDNTNKRLGVGTTAPAFKLDVRGGGQVSTDSNTNPFIISRNFKTGNYEEVRVGLDDSNAYFNYINDETISRLHFRLQNTDTESGGGVSASDYTILTLEGSTAGGYVGIGTTNPNYTLDVSGQANATQLCIAGVCQSSWPVSEDTLQTVTNRGNLTTQSVSLNQLTLGYNQPSGLLYMADAVGEEGNIERVGEIIGYNDLFLKSNVAEDQIIHLAGSDIKFWSGGEQKLIVDSDGTLTKGYVPWARLNSFPADCSVGQYVTGINAVGTFKCTSTGLDCSVLGCAEDDGAGGCKPKLAGDYDLAACKTCNGISLVPVNYVDNSQDTAGVNLCNQSCKKCSGGACVNQGAGEDLFSQCSVVWNSCDSACLKRGLDGVCDGLGSCRERTSYLSNAGKVCQVVSGVAQEVDPSSTNYCDITINCQDNACIADRYLRGCTAGAATCTETNRQSYTSWQPSLNYVINGTTYKVGTTCSTNQDLCGNSDWNKCGGAGSPYSCQKGRDEYRCNGSGLCNYDVGDNWANIASGKVCQGSGVEVDADCTFKCGTQITGCNGACEKVQDCLACNGFNSCSVSAAQQNILVAEGKVCNNGVEENPSSNSYCDHGIDCLITSCFGSMYWRGCNAVGTGCTNTNRQVKGTWNVTINNSVQVTEFRVGQTSCNISSIGYYSCASCKVCNGTGQCSVDKTNIWSQYQYGCYDDCDPFGGGCAAKRCYAGICRTCSSGAIYAPDNCTVPPCPNQGGSVCWRADNTGGGGLTCNEVCSSYGGCIAANWNDNSSCTVCRTLKGSSPACGGSLSIATTPYYNNALWINKCFYRGSSLTQNCGLSQGVYIWRVCACNY